MKWGAGCRGVYAPYPAACGGEVCVGTGALSIIKSVDISRWTARKSSDGRARNARVSYRFTETKMT